MAAAPPESAVLGERPLQDPVAQTLALLHPWIDFVPKRQRRLGVFIFLALLVHLGIFFLIRIDTTRPELQHRDRTHVTVEDAQPGATSEGSDAFWDTLTDPRLYLLPIVPLSQLPSGEPPLDLAAINSSGGFQQFPPAAEPKSYTVFHAQASTLEQQVTQTMLPDRQPFTYDETPPNLMAKTTWQWGPLLAARQPSNIPQLPSPISSTDLSPTELLVAVNAAGTVEHVLLEETCQKPELDQQAILAARKIRFGPAADSANLTWGRISVYWHYTTQATEEVVPTPATPEGP